LHIRGIQQQFYIRLGQAFGQAARKFRCGDLQGGIGADFVLPQQVAEQALETGDIASGAGGFGFFLDV
jgi:hypothetical protein